MNINLLISKNLDNAFKLLKSQVITATLNKKAVGEFNFATANVPTTPSTLSVKIIQLNSKRKGYEKPLELKEILLKSSGVEDISFYDTMTINGLTWNIGNTIANGKFITLLEINRGV